MSHEPKLPAYSREAEQSVLGSMLRDNAAIADVVQVVRRDDFYGDAHQKVFAAVIGLWERGHPADLVTVADELKRQGGVADAGGYAYLAELFDAAPTAANAEYYARIVHEKALFRGLAYAGAEIQAEAERPTGTAEQALEAAEKKVFALASVGLGGQAADAEQCVGEFWDRIEARAQSGPTSRAD